ncbi:MAG: ABC transporter permease [Ruminiclostridium sp.]|nr:ABC transporter permease [Ruminiclostridium sp.]
MLGKLMKYEIKATARWFLPMYAAILLFAGINKLQFTDPMIMDGPGFSFREIMSGLSIFIYGILFIGLMVITFVVCIIRFYKSLLGDEGYLMFTLPVETWKHIFNKLLIAMMWSVASGLFAILSILIMIPWSELAKMGEFFAELRLVFGIGGAFTVPLLTLVTLVFGVLQIYAAIALGHLSNKHKLLVSFACYIGINTVCQFFMMLAMPGFMNIMYTVNGEVENITGPVNQTMLMVIALTTIMAAGCYVLTNSILKKKLNLE